MQCQNNQINVSVNYRVKAYQKLATKVDLQDDEVDIVVDENLEGLSVLLDNLLPVVWGLAEGP